MNEKGIGIFFCMLLIVTGLSPISAYNVCIDEEQITRAPLELSVENVILVENTSAYVNTTDHYIPIYGNWTEEVDWVIIGLLFDISHINTSSIDLKGSVEEDPYHVSWRTMNNAEGIRIRIDYSDEPGVAGKGLAPGTGLLCSLVVNISRTALDGEYDVTFDIIKTKYRFTSGEKKYPILSNGTLTVLDDPPVWRNQGMDKQSILPGESIELFAQGSDTVGLDYAYLSTNETGEWKDYTNLIDWRYAKKIVIDHERVEPDYWTDIVEYLPVFIIFRNEDHCKDFVSYAQPDGDDFIFVDASNMTQYPHEIEYYNATTGELCIWVNVSSVSAEEDTVFYMYYGNPSCWNQENPRAVWDDDYLMVLHLAGENVSELKDSTGNGNDITYAHDIFHPGSHRNYTSPKYNVDIVGKGIYLDCNVDVINWPNQMKYNGSYLESNNFHLPADSSYTVEAWFQLEDDYYSHYLWCSNQSKTTGLYWHGTGGWPIANPNRIHTELQNQGVYTHNTRRSTHLVQRFVMSYDNKTNSLWYQLSYRPSSGRYSRIALDNPTVSIEDGILIGTNTERTIFFKGTIDEFRVSRTHRTTGWINNQFLILQRADISSQYEGGKYSTGLYDSPQRLQDNSLWQWTNFTWSNKTIDEDSTVGWKITYVDRNGKSTSTDIQSFSIRAHHPDLGAEGSIDFSDIEPGSTIEETFEIRNQGDVESFLDWHITSYPQWGEWGFNPVEGEDLTFKQGPIPIRVQIIIPDKENLTYEGEIRIENKDDPADYELIPISITTPENSVIHSRSLFELLTYICKRHPLLSHFINTLFSVYSGGMI